MYLDEGREEEAFMLLDGVVKHLETEVSAGIRHPENLGILVDAYALLGNDKAALETMDLAVNYGWWQFLIFKEEEEDIPGPAWWVPLQDNPDFIQSLNRMQSTRDQQAANDRNLLAQYDMELLLEPVIEAANAALELNHQSD